MNTNSVLFTALIGLVYLSPSQAAEDNAQSSGVVQKVEHAIERGAEAAAHGIQRGAEATAHGIEVAVDATKHGLKKGASATAHGVETAANKIKGSDTPATSSDKK